MELSLGASRVLRILKQTRGRYLRKEGVPGFAPAVAILSDGKVCPLVYGQPLRLCFDDTEQLCLREIDGLPEIPFNDTPIAIKNFNKLSPKKISWLGTLSDTFEYTLRLI